MAELILKARLPRIIAIAKVSGVKQMDDLPENAFSLAFFVSGDVIFSSGTTYYDSQNPGFLWQKSPPLELC